MVAGILRTGQQTRLNPQSTRGLPPKSVMVWMESSRREMRDERPARERQKKKAMARNRPPLPMLSNRTGILYEGHQSGSGRSNGCGYQMNVSPVFASPLVLRVSTTSARGTFSWYWTLKTVAKTVIPQSKLTMLLKKGVSMPSRTAPCVLFMNVAYVRNRPMPAPW